MRILVLDDTSRHSAPGRFGRTLEKCLPIEDEQIQVVVSHNRENAKAKLFADTFDIMIIHHYDFGDVTYFRGLLPKLKFVAYSAGLTNVPTSGNWEQEMLNNYQGLIRPINLRRISEVASIIKDVLHTNSFPKASSRLQPIY
jgi:hypothetical protein